jgi:hypothetical protein
MFVSVAWLDNQKTTGALDKHEGICVAIEGEEILDADSDESELIRHLDAKSNAILPNRVAIR